MQINILIFIIGLLGLGLATVMTFFFRHNLLVFARLMIASLVIDDATTILIGLFTRAISVCSNRS